MDAVSGFKVGFAKAVILMFEDKLFEFLIVKVLETFGCSADEDYGRN